MAVIVIWAVAEAYADCVQATAGLFGTTESYPNFVFATADTFPTISTQATCR